MLHTFTYTKNSLMNDEITVDYCVIFNHNEVITFLNKQTHGIELMIAPNKSIETFHSMPSNLCGSSIQNCTSSI